MPKEIVGGPNIGRAASALMAGTAILYHTTGHMPFDPPLTPLPEKPREITGGDRVRLLKAAEKRERKKLKILSRG